MRKPKLQQVVNSVAVLCRKRFRFGMRLSLPGPHGWGLEPQPLKLFGCGFAAFDGFKHLQDVLLRLIIDATQDAIQANVFRGHIPCIWWRHGTAQGALQHYKLCRELDDSVAKSGANTRITIREGGAPYVLIFVVH
jgi:hypothetical protein